MSDLVSNQRDESWEAFRFLADEMSADQRAEFESRLADESAIDELIEVCSLSEAVFQAFESDSNEWEVDRTGHQKVAVEDVAARRLTAVETEKSPRRTSVLLSQAACLLAIVGVAVALWSQDSADRLAVVAQLEANQELVRHWEIAATVVETEQPTVSEVEAIESTTDLPIEVLNQVEAEHVPDWLLAALQSQQADKPIDEEK
jgi:hypothetical protein